MTVEDLKVADHDFVNAGCRCQTSQSIVNIEVVVIEEGHDIPLGGGESQIVGGSLGKLLSQLQDPETAPTAGHRFDPALHSVQGSRIVDDDDFDVAAVDDLGNAGERTLE